MSAPLNVSTNNARRSIMDVTFFHNPCCSQSHAARDLIRARRIEPMIIEYLKTPATRDELRALLSASGGPPINIEPLFD